MKSGNMKAVIFAAIMLVSQVATAAAACTPSKRPTFQCTQTVGNNILDWKPIAGGVQMAVSAPGNVWVGLMVPDVPGQMSTNDPNETPALDSPRPSFAAIGSSLQTGNVYTVKSHEQNGIFHAMPVPTTKTYSTFRPTKNGKMLKASASFAGGRSTIIFELLWSARLPCAKPTHDLNTAHGETTILAYHAFRSPFQWTHNMKC